MQIFIGNGTMQRRDFQFRCPKTHKIRNIVIEPGHQVSGEYDYDAAQIEALRKQLDRYGAMPASDAKSIESPYTMVYSIDSGKPIPSDKLDQARERDKEVRQDIAASVTEASGLAMFATVQKYAPNALQGTDLEIEEVSPSHDEVVKSGVNYQASVSTHAGRKTTGRRRAA